MNSNFMIQTKTSCFNLVMFLVMFKIKFMQLYGSFLIFLDSYVSHVVSVTTLTQSNKMHEKMRQSSFLGQAPINL